MYPVHDVDALLLLALSLAAKRRPAELVEVIGAFDLTQGIIPPELKIVDAFSRLSNYGLILEQEGGYTLSDDAQQMMANLRKKDELPRRIYDLKEQLADYHLQGEHHVILLSEAQISAAVLAHKANKPRRSMLMPKKKVTDTDKRKPFKPFGARRRKD